jgi:hypothetical protein
MSNEYPLRVLENASIIKFHEKSSSESRVVAYGRPAGRTDMTKVIAPDNFFVIEVIIRVK